MRSQLYKIKSSLSLANNLLDLKTADTNIIIQQLEENMKIREMPIERQLQRKGLLRIS